MKIVRPALLLLIALFVAVPALANVKEAKKYKGAFPDSKPKCAACHVDDKPKKDAHDLNEYGKKVVAIKAETDETTYQAAGAAPGVE